MKRYILVLLAATAILSACTEKGRYSRLADYATVVIGVDEETGLLDGISDNGKEVLNLYRFAAMEADKIYWKQAFGDKNAIDTLPNGPLKEYAMINYGPWDRLTGKSFLRGYTSYMPKEACFYPEYMSDDEFRNCDDPLKYSPYTVMRRDENGKLKAVWYHEEYAEEVAKIASYLRAAADITIIPSVRVYLLAKAEAIETDNYRESEEKWLSMDNSRMDLVIGPTENKDDHRFGIKRSYSSYVVLKDVKLTDRVRKFTEMTGQMQASLPCRDDYKAFHPGDFSNLFVCDALYYAGEANAAIKDMAINLPFDTAIQAEYGTRTILMKNIVSAKFHHIVFPMGQLMLGDEDRDLVDHDAFFWNVAFREMAHGLGVKTTVEGAEVGEALGNFAGTIEEAKALILGVYFTNELISEIETRDIVTGKNAFATFLASTLRASRFGQNEVVGQGNLICYNYLKDQGAFERHSNGTYTINWDKVDAAVRNLASELLEIQALGDYQRAKDFVKTYTEIDEDLDADRHNVRLELIPADIKFKFAW